MAKCDDKLTFTIVSTFFIIILSMMTIKCIHEVYLDMDPSASRVFLESVSDVLLEAKPFDMGYYYVGTCEGLDRDDGGKGDGACSAGSDVDDLCHHYLHQEYPTPPGVAVVKAVARHLDDEDADANIDNELEVPADSEGAAARRLAKPKCHNLYVPWYLVNVTNPGEGAEVITRCAFKFGTQKNSETHNFKGVSMRMMPATMKVWTSRVMDNCVVGTGKLEELNKMVDALLPPNEGLVPLMGVFYCMAGCWSLMSLCSCLRADKKEEKVDSADKDSPDEGSGLEDLDSETG